MLLRAYVKRNREYHVQEFLLWYVNPEFLIVLPPANRCLREYKSVRGTRVATYASTCGSRYTHFRKNGIVVSRKKLTSF